MLIMNFCFSSLMWCYEFVAFVKIQLSKSRRSFVELVDVNFLMFLFVVKSLKSMRKLARLRAKTSW